MKIIAVLWWQRKLKKLQITESPRINEGLLKTRIWTSCETIRVALAVISIQEFDIDSRLFIFGKEVLFTFLRWQCTSTAPTTCCWHLPHDTSLHFTAFVWPSFACTTIVVRYFNVNSMHQTCDILSKHFNNNDHTFTTTWWKSSGEISRDGWVELCTHFSRPLDD